MQYQRGGLNELSHSRHHGMDRNYLACCLHCGAHPMSYQTERDEFISSMGREGVHLTVTKSLLRESTTLQRLAELECSSARADRDQVRCPAGRLSAKKSTVCLCQDYGSYDSALISSAQFPRKAHGTIPRHMVKSAASTARVVKLCAAQGLTPHFGGDPRGCMLIVSVPSGRTNDWERRGIAVPSQGYTSAQMDRICR